jgi:hypothetical protein
MIDGDGEVWIWVRRVRRVRSMEEDQYEVILT